MELFSIFPIKRIIKVSEKENYGRPTRHIHWRPSKATTHNNVLPRTCINIHWMGWQTTFLYRVWILFFFDGNQWTKFDVKLIFSFHENNNNILIYLSFFLIYFLKEIFRNWVDLWVAFPTFISLRTRTKYY